MRSNHTPARKTVLALTMGIAVGLAHIGSVLSRDTDIYFSNPNAQQQAIKPNIMVIIDTSGSMVSNTVSDGNGGQITRLQAMKNAFNTILDDPQTTNVKMGLMRFSGGFGGPVLFPVADLDAPAASIEGNGTVTVESIVTTSSDDAEQNASTGAISLTSSTLDVIRTGTTDQVVGIRFQNVTVPKGVTIKGAYIIFNANGTNSGASSAITIKAQNSSNPATFTTTTSDISNRTSAANAVATSVSWTPPDWVSGERESTADLSPIVQQLVNRSDWCGGSPMLFTLSGSNVIRRASSFDSSATNAPILVVQYDPTTVPAGSCLSKGSVQVQVNQSSDDAEERTSNGNMTTNNGTLELTNRSGNDQLVGLRFRNVAIPQGAIISSASIDFVAAANGSNATNLKIYGQLNTNGVSFSTSGRNISNRTTTTAFVNWSPPSVSSNNTFTTPDLTTVVQEIVNQSGWVSGNSLVTIVKTASGSGDRSVTSYDGNTTKAPILHVSFQVNASATTVPTLTVRERLKQIVNGLQASGNTPIVDALWEAGLYYRAQPILYGLQRGDQSGLDAQYTRVSYLPSYTGGGGVFRDPACTDANLNATACATEQITGSPTYVSPFEDGCQNSYIVLLTDGAPTANNSTSLVTGLTGGSCAASVGGTSGNCTNELVGYYHTHNLSSFSDSHSLTTFTIGFGSDVTNATDVDYLTQMATNGGGTFTPAQDASSLVSAFQGILSQVNSAPTAFVSPSLSVNAFNKLFDRDEVFFSLFSPQLEVSWPGNIKKFNLCNQTGANASCVFGDILDANNQPAIDSNSKIKATAKSIWSSTVDGPTIKVGGSGENIPARASRKVYTYTGAADVPASAIDLSGSAYVVNTTNVTKTMLGDAAMTNQRQSDIVNWMLGQDIKDENKNGSTADDRWKFADALHSRPLTLTYGGSDPNNPVIKMFVGTNDGALRMINTNNGTNRGQEEWAVYFPEFLANQGALMDDAQNVHIGGVDGTPTAYVIDNNNNGIIEPANGDKVYIFVGERRGGRNLYAFDVTPDGASALTDPTQVGGIKPKFLWRIRGGTGNFGALGQTWSRPVVTKIRIKSGSGGNSTLKTVLIFAGGYDPGIDVPGSGNVVPPAGDSMGNAIYIVDPLTGALVWSMGLTGSGANLTHDNMKYAIPSDLALLDTNGDGATDRIYVGDSRGQIWRVDLGDQIDPGQSGTGGSKAYVFADVGCSGGTRSNDCSATSRQQHHMFFYPPDVAQAADTLYSPSQPDYDLVVVGTGNREDPLDKLTAAVSSTEQPVHNRIYAFRDYNFKTGPYGATAPTTLTETDLYDATANNLGTLSGSALQTEIQNNVVTKKGWFIRLKESTNPQWIGEKVLAKPVIFGGQLFVTTFVPTPSSAIPVGTCQPLSEGSGRLYVMNYLDATPVYDFNNDGTKDRQYTVGGGIPSEAVIVIREGGVTTLIGTSGGAAHPPISMSLPRYQTYWYEN